jgi:hypothetical protein
VFQGGASVRDMHVPFSKIPAMMIGKKRIQTRVDLSIKIRNNRRIIPLANFKNTLKFE